MLRADDSEHASRVARFGVFELDCEAGELRRAGVRVPLTGQPLRVLALLVSRAGRIVTRDEIRREIWGDDTHVDLDAGLSTCINQVRTALGDRAASPRYIETLPRRGYRFVAPVDRAQAAEARTVPRLRRAGVVTAVALAAAIVIAAPWNRRPALPPTRIGVFAVDVDPSTPQLAPVSVSLTHALIGALASEAGGTAQVLSAPAARELGDKPMEEIGRSGVGYALLVTLRSAGGPVLVHVKLVRCTGGWVVWASDRALPLDELEREQLRIAGELSKQVARRLPGG
jgi:DNA-binding winged helix-turn-helix (wHTH) protein/TolB-like protein